MKLNPIRKFVLFTAFGFVSILIQTTEPLAKCNGWEAGWCSERYRGEIDTLKREIPELQARKLALPGAIQAIVNDGLRIEAQINGIKNQIPLKTQIIANAQTNNEAFSQILAAAKASSELFRSLAKGIQEQIPSLIARLHQFLYVRESLIAERLAEIDQLLKTTTETESVEALIYERQRLIDVQTFAGAYDSVDAAREVLKRAFQGDVINLNVKLPPETSALLREAANFISEYRDSDEAVSKVERHLNEIAVLAEKSLAVNAATILQQTGEISALKAEVELLSKSRDSLNLSIAELNKQLASIPDQIGARNYRLPRADVYWHCCDNEPFCRNLPGENRDESKYRDFENSITTDVDGPKCRKGGDL